MHLILYFYKKMKERRQCTSPFTTYTLANQANYNNRICTHTALCNAAGTRHGYLDPYGGLWKSKTVFSKRFLKARIMQLTSTAVLVLKLSVFSLCSQR